MKEYLMERGIVALPGIITPLSNGFRIDRGLSEEEIRYYLLYWDKVVIPTTNIVHQSIPEEDLLLETCVIERPKVIYTGEFHGNYENSFLLPAVEVAKKLIDEDKQREWVIHQFGNKIILPQEQSITNNSLKLEIMNVLPVPNKDVNIHDVLEFKLRRKDELKKLFETIDEIYISILNSPDKPFQEKKELLKLQEDIENLQKTYNEKWKISSKFNFAVELEWKHLPLMSGIIFDIYSGTTVPTGTIMGALSELISIKPSTTLSLESNQQQKYAYLSSAYQETIIQ